VLESRDHWSELGEKYLTLFNFKWAPISRLCNFDQLSIHGQKKLVNHFERHDYLSTKDGLFNSMVRYCEQNKLDVFQYLPIQFVFDFGSKNMTKEIERFCNFFN